MQQQMNFLMTPLPADTVPVWAVLDDQQRAEAAATLARLIAKVAVVTQSATAVAGRKEKGDE